MNTRPVYTTKKSNIKCEHCRYFERSTDDIYVTENPLTGTLTYHMPQSKCLKSDIPKNYWNRCKQFEWREEYLDEN